MTPRLIADRRAGIALAAAAAGISGVSVWVNAFGVSQIPDAVVYTTLKNAVAAVILLGLAASLRATPIRSAPLTRTRAVAVLAVGVLGGGLAFVLFFSGLAQATAAGAAFIQKTMFIWVAVLAVPLLGERLGLAQLAGLGVLLLGQILLAPPRAVGWGAGETMILVATLIWAGEVIVVRRLLGGISPVVLGMSRLGIGLLVLAGVVVVGGHLAALGAVSTAGWAIVGVTGVLLAGYVATWFSALQRAPASLVTSVLVGGAVVTAALQAAASGRMPDGSAVAGAGLLVAAVVVIGWSGLRGRHPEALADQA